MSIEREIINRLAESRRVKENIQSSFEKDVMRAVNAEAPNVLHWKKGDKILSMKTKKVAIFQGYRKDPITGKYLAILSHNGEEIRYTLSDLQKEVKDHILRKYA